MISKAVSDTPILILTFNRPDFVAELLQLLEHVEPKRLYVSIDGPRNKQDEKKIAETLEHINEEVTWDCKVKINKHPKNMGCKNGVMSGLSWFFKHEEAGIILEDDVMPNDSFFKFCTELLVRYKDDDRILLISGDNFFPDIKIEGSYTFINHVPIWGWASWRDRWEGHIDIVDGLSMQLLENNKSLFSRQQQNLIGASIEGRIDTWDYLFLFTQRITQKLAIIPSMHLVKNIGATGASTHTKLPLFQFFIKVEKIKFPLMHPHKVALHNKYSQRMERMYHRAGLILESLRFALSKIL